MDSLLPALGEFVMSVYNLKALNKWVMTIWSVKFEKHNKLHYSIILVLFLLHLYFVRPTRFQFLFGFPLKPIALNGSSVTRPRHLIIYSQHFKSFKIKVIVLAVFWCSRTWAEYYFHARLRNVLDMPFFWGPFDPYDM